MLARPAKKLLCPLLCLALVLGLVPSLAAQVTTRGTVLIEFTGMVQSWPGNDVLTLEVKKQHIFFALHDVHSSGQRFLRERFLSDLRLRSPGPGLSAGRTAGRKTRHTAAETARHVL